jgi:hypothetical protein
MIDKNHYNVGINNPNYGKSPTHKGTKNPNWKNGITLIKKFCPICGKQLKSYQSNMCRSCASKKVLKKCKQFLNIDKSGKNNPMYGIKRNGIINPNWKGGISKFPYSFEFNQELKESIRKRDGYKCRKCDISENIYLKTRKRVLDIHHIDYNKNNCSKENLITLCSKCNVQANGNRDYWFAYYTYILQEK